MMVTAEELLRERIAIVQEKHALAIAEHQTERAERHARLSHQLQVELDKLITTGDPNVEI